MAGGLSDAQPEPRRGRHRRGGGGDTWTPSVPRSGPRRAHARTALTWSTEDTVILPPLRGPATAATEPVAYAWPETPPTGLRKFDLGTIPASVTPPRTWRRAAWFAVGTSTCVVLGLGFAAYTLVGNPARHHIIDALPGQPTQQLLITDVPATTGSAVAPSSVRPTSTSSTSSSTKPRPTSRSNKPTHRVEAGGSSPGQLDTPAGPTRPGHGATTTTTAPPRNTVDPAPIAPTDPEAMGDRTEQYYQHVTDNPEAAYALTTGKMRAEGVEGIEARYADVERIEVREITIDPNWSVTRSELTIVYKDGSTAVEERELTFSQGANPRINGDVPAS